MTSLILTGLTVVVIFSVWGHCHHLFWHKTLYGVGKRLHLSYDLIEAVPQGIDRCALVQRQLNHLTAQLVQRTINIALTASAPDEHLVSTLRNMARQEATSAILLGLAALATNEVAASITQEYQEHWRQEIEEDIREVYECARDLERIKKRT